MWCSILASFAVGDGKNQQLFGTAAVRDALIAVHPHATKAETCECWCSAVCNITYRSAANQRLFGTAAVRDALVALCPQATTALVGGRQRPV
jgi:hypothetical protein